MILEKIERNWTHDINNGRSAIQTIDMHTGGEPLRVIYNGTAPLQGKSVLDYRDDMRDHHDHIRRLLMSEPRGHSDMYGCMITPPNDPSGDFGILFLHNEGYSTMCGHAILAITKLAAVLDWKEADENGVIQLKIDAPCGRVLSSVDLSDNSEFPVQFLGVPSFAAALDQYLELPGLGRVKFDIAYGGAFYAYLDADQIQLQLIPKNLPAIIGLGKEVKKLVSQQFTSDLTHPFDDRMSFLYGTIFTSEKQQSSQADSKNVCVFADGEVDRCPTGSGASGRMALLDAKDQITKGKDLIIESIVESRFRASVSEILTFGPHKAVIPKVAGNAFVTGRHSFFLDPGDEFQEGFFLR